MPSDIEVCRDQVEGKEVRFLKIAVKVNFYHIPGMTLSLDEYYSYQRRTGLDNSQPLLSVLPSLTFSFARCARS